jgi:hypothetical protein
MKRSSKKITVIICLLLLVATALFGWEGYRRKTIVKVAFPTQAEVEEPVVIDTAKLRLMGEVCDKLNFNRDEFLIVGSLSANDGADSAGRLDPEVYVFSKKGSSFYFRLGQTETINKAGLYLYVDHSQKKIMVSAEKTATPNPGLPRFKELIKRIKEEGYSLESRVEGTTEIIAVSNPYHLSCKNYAIYFDAATLVPERLYMRLTDAYEPEDPKKDKVIDLKIKQASRNSDLEKYTRSQIVKKENDKWVPGTGYDGYELIVL